MARLSKVRKELLTTMMKESIFTAATTVLCEHGVDGTTMNRVAEAAELAKSSLYDYFPSKDDLLVFVYDRHVAPFLDAVERIVLAEGPATGKLQQVLRTAFESSSTHKAVIRMLSQSDQEYQMRKRTRPRILEALTAIFEQGIREGDFHSCNPSHAARLLLGSLSELFELHKTGATEESIAAYQEMMSGLILRGFAARGRETER